MFQKKKFDVAVDSFSTFFLCSGRQAEYLWVAQDHFLNNWNMNVLNFEEMLDRSLDENSEPAYLPMIRAKEILLKMAAANEDLVRSMFTDLYNEGKDLSGRMGRFEFHCDLLLKSINNDFTPIPEHFHSKYVVFNYLTFRYPDKYMPYDHKPFYQVMQQLGSPNPPESYELDRYFKIARIMHKFLRQNEKISAYLDKQNVQRENSLLLTYEFIRFMYTQSY